MEHVFVGFVVDFGGRFGDFFGFMEGQNWKLFLEGIWKASVQDFGTVSCAFVATLGSGKCILAQHYSSFHTF